MAPHRVASWRDVVTELVNLKAEVLEEYDEIVYPYAETMTPRVPGWSGRMPAVVRLTRPVASYKKGIKFSRINVFTRDGFSCQYCGARKAKKDLNYDHVIPRIQGGQTVWWNIVTSCYPCNDRKAGRTPEQAGMKLLRQPFKPKTLPMTPPMLGMHEIPELWKPYLDAASAQLMVG
jgi:5-methylcytosine-specific restriction endonuclease McrA